MAKTGWPKWIMWLARQSWVTEQQPKQASNSLSSSLPLQPNNYCSKTAVPVEKPMRSISTFEIRKKRSFLKTNTRIWGEVNFYQDIAQAGRMSVLEVFHYLPVMSVLYSLSFPTFQWCQFSWVKVSYVLSWQLPTGEICQLIEQTALVSIESADQ